jgi:branched-chain amino acid transport system permease protein
MDIFINAAIVGLLLGGVYGLIASGLSLIWGVMEVVNFAHGEFLMLSMFATYFMSVYLGCDPYLTILPVAAGFFLFGELTYHTIIKRIMNGPMLAQVFSTYGISLFLANLALFLWGFEFRSIPEELIRFKGIIYLGDYPINLAHLSAAVGCMVTYLLLIWFMNMTKTGKALRAVSQDREAAALMGIEINRMNGMAWGVSSACVAVAGAFLAAFFFINPAIGTVFSTLTFVIVVLGGFGSILGSFVGGVVIGLVQSFVGVMLPGFELVIAFSIFFLVLLIRPQGIFGF